MERQVRGDSARLTIGDWLPDWVRRGGPGSGHHGHAGRPGERGGSLPGEATGQPEEAKGGLPSFALEARDIMQANSLYWPSTVKVVPESDIPIANKELFEAIAAYQATSDTLWIADGVSPEAKVPRGLAVRSPLGVVLHELGHANHAHWAPGKYSGDEWMTDNEMDVAIKVSDYALYGKTEFVAEVFASKVAGIEVPPDALALYQKWGGPVVNMVERGGPGSGHFGHAGRPGARGGSLPGDATQSDFAPHGDKAAAQVVAGRWNPEADLAYHWTDRDGMTSILDALRWDAGSATINPRYRFDEYGKRRWAVVLDRSRMREEPAPQTVPWEEWEVISKDDAELMPVDPEDSIFVGFAVRTQRDAAALKRMITSIYDPEWATMWPIHLVANRLPLRLKSIIERGGPGSGHFGHEGRPGQRGGSAPGDGETTVSEAHTSEWIRPASPELTAKVKDAITTKPYTDAANVTYTPVGRKVNGLWDAAGGSQFMSPDGEVFAVYSHWHAVDAVIPDLNEEMIAPMAWRRMVDAIPLGRDEQRAAGLGIMYSMGWLRLNTDKTGLWVELAKGQTLTRPQAEAIQDWLATDPNELTVDVFDIDQQKQVSSKGSTTTSRQAAANLLGLTARGGPGSGHFGHAGRPGERGGSVPGDGGAVSENVEAIVVGDDPQAASVAGDRLSDAIRHLPEVFRPIDILDPARSVSGWLLPDGSFYGNYNHTVGATAATKAAAVSLHPDQRARSGSREIDTMLASGIMRITKYGMRPDTPGGLSLNLGMPATQEQKSALRDWLAGNPEADVVADYQPVGADHIFVSSRMHLGKIGIVERGGPGSGHHDHAGRPGERGGSLPGYHDGFPVVFDGSLKSEGEYRDNKILIGPKFFDLPDGAGIHVLNHEAGHAVSDQMLADGRAFKLQDAGAFTGMFDGREVRGIHGHATPGENVAEAYAVYKEDPAWLAEHYPLAFEAMAAYLVTRGGPGSGHFGHAGRPGERGGSVPGDAAQSSDESSGAWHSQSDPETMDAMKQAMVAGMTDIYGPRPISTMTSVYGIANGSLWVAPDGTILRVPTHWESALRAIESVDQEKIAPAMMGILHRAAGLDRSEFGSAAVSAMYTFGWMRANMSNGALMVELAKQQALTVAQAEIVEDYLDVVPDDLTVDIFDIPSQRLLVSIGSSGTSRQAPANALGLVARGGPGSGHFDHAGRPGERGGSLPGEAASDESRRASAGHQPATAGKFTSEDIFDRIKTSMQYQAEGNKKYGVKSPDQVVDGLRGGGYWHIWVTPDGEGIRVMDHGFAGNRVRIDIKKAVYGEGMPRTPDVKRIITAHDDYAALYGVGMVRLSGYAARAGAMPSIGVTVPGGDYPAPTRGQAEYISDLYFRLKDADWSVESASGGNVGAWLLVDFETAAPRLGLPLRSAPDLSAYLYIPLISEDAVAAMATEIGRWLNRYAIEGMATPSERLHCTLLYLERVTEEQIQGMFEGLALPLKFRCEVTGLARMGDALVALLDPDPALLRLQKDLWMAAKRVGATIGSFSNPAEYKPHISLAYDLPPLLRLEDLNMDPAMFTHGEKLDVACSAFAIGREDKDGLRTIVLPSHAGDRLFVIQGGVGIQPHIIKGRPMVELTQEQWKAVMRGQPVYLRGTRRLITRADGPFRVRGGEGSGHYGHAGRPGERGGSLPGEAGQQAEAWQDTRETRDAVTLALAGVVQRMPGGWVILKEDTASDYSGRGWLGPDGNLYLAREQHLGLANAALMAAGAGTPKDYGNGEVVLKRMGFGRMIVTSDEFMYNGNDQLTPEQALTINNLLATRRGAVYADTPNYVSEDEFGDRDHVSAMVDHAYELVGRSRPIVIRGGPGSGHFDHAGIPGHQGGSLAGEAGQAGEEGDTNRLGEGTPAETKWNAIVSENMRTADRLTLEEAAAGKEVSWWLTPEGEFVDVRKEFARGQRTHDDVAATLLGGEDEAVSAASEMGIKAASGLSRIYPGDVMLQGMRWIRGGFRSPPSGNLRIMFADVYHHPTDAQADAIKSVYLLGRPTDFEMQNTQKAEMSRNSRDIEWAFGEMPDLATVERGGPGSGHFDHAGIPGHQGGSLPSGVAGKFETEEQGARAAEAEGWTRNRNIQSGNLHYQSPRIQVGEKDGEAVWRQQQATLRYDAVDGYHWEVSEEKHAIGATSDEAFGVSGTVIAFQPAAPRASSGRPSGGRTRGGAPAGYKYKPAAGGLSLTNPLAGSRAGFGAVTARGTTRSDLAERGGPGSGHFDHAGIPGHRGGSLPGEVGQATEEAQTTVASADAVDFERRLLERFGDTEPVAGTWIGPSGKYLVHLGDHQETAMWLLGRDPKSIPDYGKRIEAGLIATNDVVRAGLVRYNIAHDFVYFDIPSRAQTTREQKDAMALVVEKVGEDQGRWPFAVITLGPPFTNLPDDAKWEEDRPITTEMAYKFLGIEDFEPYTPYIPAVERRESLLSSIYRAIEAVIRGGEGSGHRGHQGIPGHRGGSLPSEGGPKEPVKKPRAPRKPREAKPKPVSKPAPKPAPPAHTGTRPKPAAAPVIKRKDVSSSYLRRTMSRMAEDYAQRRFDGTIDSFAEYMRTQAANLYFTDRIAAMFAEVLQKDESSPEVLEAMANFFDKAAQSPFDALVRAETTKLAKEQYEPGESRALSDLAAVPTPPRFDAVRAGFEAIDSVHTVPDFTNQILRPTPELQLPILETTRGDRYGVYISLGAKAVSIRFNLGMPEEHAEMTTAHEAGHLIDHLALGSANGVSGTRVLGPVANYQADVDEGRMRAAMGGDLATDDAIERVGNLREVMRAVTNTSSYFSLRAFPTGPSLATRSGKDYEVYIDRAFLNQAASPSELFARAYSQYIAVRSGNTQMGYQLEGFQGEARRGGVPLQWQRDEFKPVTAAFDKLFGDAGWLNK